MSKTRVGVVGCTGMVGQRFITLLHDHPWFEVVLLAASSNSAYRPYAEAVAGRWVMPNPIPERIAGMPVWEGTDIKAVSPQVDLVFCAVDMPQEQVRMVEERYARQEVVVVSANSANRWNQRVPMIIPEVNPHHLRVIPSQREWLGTRRGCIVVKPNCSIQTFVPPLHRLTRFKPTIVAVATYQAISGAGKTFDTWPEMRGNVIPYIGGEEEKTAREPHKIWGRIEDGIIIPALESELTITSQCFRVPVLDGHMAAVWVRFETVPTTDEIIACWTQEPEHSPHSRGLPSAPEKDVVYFSQEDRPQTRLDRDVEGGMATCVGQLRKDPSGLFDFKFAALSHNTIRGAAGGAILTAELMKAEGFLEG